MALFSSFKDNKSTSFRDNVKNDQPEKGIKDRRANDMQV